MENKTEMQRSISRVELGAECHLESSTVSQSGVTLPVIGEPWRLASVLRAGTLTLKLTQTPAYKEQQWRVDRHREMPRVSIYEL